MTDFNEMVIVYKKIRAKKAELNKANDEAVAALDGKLALLESRFLKHFIETGTTSLKTPEGTAYTEDVILPSAGDWEKFGNFICENKALDFLEKRIVKKAVKDYMEKNKGALPPGVNVHREVVVKVRKASSKPGADDDETESK